MPLNNLSNNGKPQPAPSLFCCEKRIKYLFYILLSDPTTHIFNLYSIMIFFLINSDGDGAGIFHGLNGVYKYIKKGPVKKILVGSKFWAPLNEWMRRHQLAPNYISAEDLDLFQITDDVEWTANYLAEYHRKQLEALEAEREGLLAAWQTKTAEGTTTGKSPRHTVWWRPA